MPDEVFVDTNILVYAHDVDAGAKHDAAVALIDRMWRTDPLPWISVQVLQELLVNLVRRGVTLTEARETIADYSNWRVVENTVALLGSAVAEMERWQLSLWDALILAAARSAGATRLWSEDLSDGQDYGGVLVSNPFAS